MNTTTKRQYPRIIHYDPNYCKYESHVMVKLHTTACTCTQCHQCPKIREGVGYDGLPCKELKKEKINNYYCCVLRTSHPNGGICTRKVPINKRCWQHKGKPTWSLEQIRVSTKQEPITHITGHVKTCECKGNLLDPRCLLLSIAQAKQGDED